MGIGGRSTAGPAERPRAITQRCMGSRAAIGRTPQRQCGSSAAEWHRAHRGRSRRCTRTIPSSGLSEAGTVSTRVVMADGSGRASYSIYARGGACCSTAAALGRDNRSRWSLAEAPPSPSGAITRLAFIAQHYLGHKLNRRQESGSATPPYDLPRGAVAHDAQHRTLRRSAGPGDQRAVRERCNRRIRTGTIGHRCA